jgi:hypothetical protein
MANKLTARLYASFVELTRGDIPIRTWGRNLDPCQVLSADLHVMYAQFASEWESVGPFWLFLNGPTTPFTVSSLASSECLLNQPVRISMLTIDIRYTGKRDTRHGGAEPSRARID